MKPLPRSMTVPLCEGETPASFCSRNAMLIGRTAREFCQDAGFGFQGLVDGDRPSIEALATRCRADAGLLLATAAVKTGRTSYRVRNQIVTRAAMPRGTVRVCPLCLEQDIEVGRVPRHVRPYGRLAWQMDAIRTCREHGIGFAVASTDITPARLHDFAVLIQPRLPALDEMTKEARRRGLSGLERHLLDRLDGIADAEAAWVASFPFYATARICEVLGAVAIKGVGLDPDSLSDSEWQDAGGIGYEIAREGEAGIRSLLVRLQEGFVGGRRAWGVRSVFGYLHTALLGTINDPAYEPLREIVRQHVIETMPVGKSDKIFGTFVSERRIHSIRSATLELGVHRKRLRKLLLAAGVIPEASADLSDERVTFDAIETGPLLARIADCLSLEQAGKYLGAHRPHPRLLFEAGFIKPFVIGGTEAFKDHGFTKSSLDDFLERLLAGAVPLGPNEVGFFSIPMTAKRASCSAMEIVRLLLDGKLTQIRVRPSQVGYLSVAVDPEEVKPLVLEVVPHGLGLVQASKRMRIDSSTVRALVDLGHLPSRKASHPASKRPQIVLDEQDVDLFLSRYGTKAMMSAQMGVRLSQIWRAIKNGDVKPAFDQLPTFVRFYDRLEIEKHLDGP